MRLVLALTILVFAGSANAIYKCKNPDGSISFSDAPCGVRDDGVDIEKERRFQESLQRRAEEEKARQAEKKRERQAKLSSVRKRTEAFLNTYFKVVDKKAVPPYIAEEYPELEEKFYDRMVDIENFRIRAVRLVLNTQQCDKVMSSSLDDARSTKEKVWIEVTCRNGNRFPMDELAIENGATPKAIPAGDSGTQ